MHACGRKGFSIDKITKGTYICSPPFVGGNGPTEKDSDPINASLLGWELARKKDRKKRKRPLESDTLLNKKKKVRTKKHSEMEISPLNSTVQNDATDFDELLLGFCQHCPTYHPMISNRKYSYPLILVMTYDVPLQFSEPEVNEENKTSKEPSVPASPVKTDKSTQTKYDR